MIELAPSVFFNFFFYLFIPFLGGYLANRLKLQPLIGYIIGGIILGNLFTGLVSKETMNQFANIGIIFLLFTIGLEINFARILALKKFIILGGLLQIILSFFLIALVSPLFGFSLFQSVLIGVALSSSSTTIVAKIIQEKGEESSFIGEIALGVLMFQDLAFIPFVIIFKYLNSETAPILVIVQEMLLATAASALILTSMYYFGHRILPIIFDKVAKSSRELLNLFIFMFIFLVCFLSSFLGVPVLISAFIAGVLVSQTSEHQHIFSQLRPVRDLMAIIFFVYIGVNVGIPQVLPHLLPIVLFSTLVLTIKFLILISIFAYFRMNSRITFYLSLFLFQIDEDAFILLSLGYLNKMFSLDQYVMLTSTVIISLLLTPALINKKESMFKKVREFMKKNLHPLYIFVRQRLDADFSPIDVINIKDHVVICGYGRIGTHIGRALHYANIPFIAIDYNFQILNKARKEGVQMIYGDATDIDILDYAEVDNALVLISAVPDKSSQETIILNAKRLNPRIVVISRIHHHSYSKRMKDLGADIVVEPELEASLSIIKKIYFLKKLPQEEIVRKLRHFKMEQGIG